MPKKKDSLVFGLKLIVSLSLLGFILFWKTSPKAIFRVLSEVDLFWIILSFSLHSLGLLISAVRWQILIRAQGDTASLIFLAKSYLVGAFFNNFLPTRIGGDAVRIWDGSKSSQSVLKSFAIVLVERLTGILFLLLFALAGALIRIDMARNKPIIWVSLILGGCGIVFLFLFLSPLTPKILKLLPDKKFLEKIKQKTMSLRETVLFYRGKKAALAKALFWALLLQINVIVHFFFIGKALHLDISFIDYFIFIPIVLLIQLIPITINGLGLREGAYVVFLQYYGHTSDTAVSFALIDVGFMLIVGIIGGIIYMTRR